MPLDPGHLGSIGAKAACGVEIGPLSDRRQALSLSVDNHERVDYIFRRWFRVVFKSGKNQVRVGRMDVEVTEAVVFVIFELAMLRQLRNG